MLLAHLLPLIGESFRSMPKPADKAALRRQTARLFSERQAVFGLGSHSQRPWPAGKSKIYFITKNRLPSLAV